MDTTGSDHSADGDEATVMTVMEALKKMSMARKSNNMESSNLSTESDYFHDDADIDEGEEGEAYGLNDDSESESSSLNVLDPEVGAELPFHQQCRLMKSSRFTAHLRSEGYRPPHIAARLGRVELFWWLVNHEEDFLTKTATGHSVFHIAAEYGHLELVKGIFERFCNHYGRSDKRIDSRSRTTSKCTALHLAASHGHLEVVRFLINTVYLSHREKNAELLTPLMVAAQSGHLHVVIHLHTIVRASLIEIGQYKYTALLLSALHGHLKVVDYCIKHGSSKQEKTNLLNTALHVASMGGHTHIVNYLLTKHSDAFSVNDQNANGQTALHLAAWAGHSHIAELLITKYGSSIETTNLKGNTPFLMACLRGYRDVAKLLIGHGSSFTERNLSQNNGILLAAYGGHVDIIAWLLDPATESGLSLKDTSAAGNTPLLQAAAQAHLDTVIFLLEELHADINERNILGRNAIDLASRYEKVLEYLQEYIKEHPLEDKPESAEEPAEESLEDQPTAETSS